MTDPEAYEPSVGVELIAQERTRQIRELGYTAEHDRAHGHPMMARAAACYATPDYLRRLDSWRNPVDWPWDIDAWNPNPDDRRRELVKAGALIAAAIDAMEKADL